MRTEYAHRERRLAESDLYSLFNPANLYIIQRRQRDVLAGMRRHGFYPLKEYRLLEVGCGSGGVLLECLSYGSSAQATHGTDLLFERVSAARTALQSLPLTCADGQALPYEDGAFDLVLQFTVFSSILEERPRFNLAREMQRVLRKPGGMILWYDFWLNPTNPHARGLRPSEIRQLFDGFHIEFRRVTLAPPLVRLLVPISWTLAALVEKLRLFNSHYLAFIFPRA